MAIHKHAGAVTLILASLVGFGIALYFYLMPLTGVNGTAGALLVVVSSLLMVIAGLVLYRVPSGTFALLVRVLTVLGTVGTLAAAWFLHEFWLMAAMAIALLGVIIDSVSAKGGARP